MSKQEKTTTKATKKTAAATPKARAPKLAGDAAESKLVALVALVKERAGLASSEIASAIGITQLQARGLIAKAIENGAVFRGGNRRFARYASTQAAADSASLAARAPKVAA